MNLTGQLRSLLMEKLDPGKDQEDDQILELIDELILNREESRYLPVAQKDELRRELFYSVRRLDVLQELLDDPEVTEIMVNGYRTIYVERRGKIEKYRKAFSSGEKFEDVIQQIVGRCNRIVNEQNPIVDARLENGDRVNVVMRPIALNGPILTIRRFPPEAITMEHLILYGSITREAAELMKQLVRERYTIMIGGATGSGKTTFLNALSAYIPKDERIITIEDNAELQIQGIDNLVRLEAREATLEHGTDITIRDLIRTALRMRPNRIVIGEVRGEETFELLSALHTGHAGSISTAHANSTRDMIHRLETMVLMGMQLPLMAIRRQIASGIDILVHLGRGGDGSRRVEEIAQIVGMEGEEVRIVPLYRWDGEHGLTKKTDLFAGKKE
ncbi:MAG: CpaF family protein [Fusicatenibacter sp.]|nr:CpaF family protein [Fusicatenibacter sp.]